MNNTDYTDKSRLWQSLRLRKASKQMKDFPGWHYCSGISDFLKINIYHDVPEVAIGEFFALIDLEIAKLARYSDQCIILKTKITVKDKPISFDLLFIPYFDSIEKFINWLDVDYIFNLLDSESKTIRFNKPSDLG